MNCDNDSEYEIKQTIGKGNFGKVLLGISKNTGEKYAIKIIDKSKINKFYNSSQIKREINVLSQMDHLNIVKVHKIEDDKKKYKIIMEYCEKGELYEYIVEQNKLNPDEAAYYYFQLINGLEFIHSKNIVHRDLKPENLLITNENILKIIDFGLSNYHNINNLLSTPCGSPSYASPEMVSGNKYNGILVDIWSTGIILFAMLSGYLPFEGNDNYSLFKKIIKCEINYPDDIPDIALDLMKKILVSDPKKRISISKIKKHPFYLEGKKIFGSIHKEYLKKIEKPIKKKICKVFNSFRGKYTDKKIEQKKYIFFKSKEINLIDKNNNTITYSPEKNYENLKENIGNSWIRNTSRGVPKKNFLCFNITLNNGKDNKLFSDEHNNIYNEMEVFKKKNVFNKKKKFYDKIPMKGQICLTENNADNDTIKYKKPLMSPKFNHLNLKKKLKLDENYLYYSTKKISNLDSYDQYDNDESIRNYSPVLKSNRPYKRPSLKEINISFKKENLESNSQRNTINTNNSIKLYNINVNNSSNLSSKKDAFIFKILNLKKNENNNVKNNKIKINPNIYYHKSFNLSLLKDEKYIY